MIVQYTSAALASENKSLCFPASADSISTSLGQEDHVSMGSIAARKALRVIENVEKILAIELLCASQALDYHRPLGSGRLMELVHKYVRINIDHLEEDVVLHQQIDTATGLISTGVLVKLLEQHGLATDLQEYENLFGSF